MRNTGDEETIWIVMYFSNVTQQNKNNSYYNIVNYPQLK